ncbi:MAG: GapR family DNA-binding domain-containing protein, partial [Acetobacteraceae bacterium]
MADQKLVGFVDRLVRLGEEKREIADAIKDLYVEAKA